MSDFFSKKMIEIVWTDNLHKDYEIMMCATNLISWLVTTIAQDEDYNKIVLNGFMLVKEVKGGCTSLLICDESESQKQLLKLLQQPPGEFKDRYIARIPSEEPDPVKEIQKENEDDDDDDDDKDENT